MFDNIFEKKSNVLMVKRGEFIGSLGGKFAYKLTSEYTAEKIPINIGTNSIDYVELTSGVSEGEQLIISDYQTFANAQQINISD